MRKHTHFTVSLLHRVFVVSDLHRGGITYTWLKVILFIYSLVDFAGKMLILLLEIRALALPNKERKITTYAWP